jgi:hypothetical protein
MKNRFFLTVILLCACLLSSVIFAGCEAYEVSSAEKAITSFGIGAATGVITDQAITITVPYGTDVTGLSPVIRFTGNTVSPASEAAQDFTNPVTYRVTADDGSARDYVVIVRPAEPAEKAITSFSIGAAAGAITDQAITITVPYGTDVTSLSPVILFTGSAVSPASETPQDFTNPVTYQVTAGDGSTKDYTVIVRYAVSDTKVITAFKIGAATGVITGQNITVTVPYNTDIANLSPDILFTGSAVSPASGTPQNFTDPVTYRVSAGDGSARDYTVTVQAQGRGPVKITFTSLPYEKIDLTFDEEKDLSRAQKDVLQITVAGAPARWFIDGKEQSETAAAISIAAIDYPVGTHHVTALIYKDGIPYSDEVIFKIVQ